MKNKNPNSLGSRVKVKMKLETPEEKKERIARQRKTIEYFESIHNKPAPANISNITIPIDWMKKEFYETAKTYFAKERKKFEVDEENRLMLDIICRYFANDSSFEEVVQNGNLDKGLLIIGNCGTGKSSIFDIIQQIGRKHNIPQLWFSKVSCLEITTQFAKENKQSYSQGNQGHFNVMENYTKGKVYFDDLGSENLVNDFGIKKEIMKEILEIRYNRFKEFRTKTFCSTNLTVPKLVEKYDKGSPENHKRIEDRIYGMFNILPMYGNTQR